MVAAAAGLLAASLALVGCSGGSAPEPTAPADTGGEETSTDPIRVIVLGGIGAQGVLQANATTSITAAKASVEQVNANGGILGREVALEIIDDTADPTVAVTKLREALSNGEKPALVMNSGPSTVADATIPILGQEGILSFNIGPSATSGDPSVNPYNFDLGASVGDYIRSFIDEFEQRSYEKIAILHGSSQYGEAFGAEAESASKEAGFEVTGVQGYDNAALDMTPQLEALRSGDPDVVVLDSYGAPLAYVLEGVEKLGWDIPIMGNTSVAATSYISTEAPEGALGTDRVKNLTMQVYTSTKHDPDDAEVNEAVNLMLESGEILSSLILAYNFDSMALLKAAAESAQSLDADALATALVDPDVLQNAGTTILREYNFNEESHSPNISVNDMLFISPGPLVNGQYQ